MATYFHGNPEIQGDGLQTLILMNPGYVGYSSDPQQQSTVNNFVFLNSAAAAAGNPMSLPHAPSSNPHSHQPYIAGVAQDPSPHEISALQHQHHGGGGGGGFAPRVEYNLWNQVEPPATARDTPRATSQQQGLSLSLSSHQQQPHPYGSYRGEGEIGSQTAAVPAAASEGVRISGGSSSPPSGITNGVSGLQQSVLLSSKYLKAAQQLLDEVVNVGNSGVKTESTNKRNHGRSKMIEDPAAAAGEGAAGGDSGGGKRSGAELSTAERQEIQMKKAKLVGMLDEVEQRYRQYHSQMQIVISIFEQVAGIGSAKTYTALALQTISKQFRCLKDAISAQIRSANKCLGEDDYSSGGGGGKIEGGSSRLKFVDNQIRQQRALQQLGMIQHNAWRPQRGLPERSVSVLRAWLFEHFLHPYPKDSDKHMLAKQAGLTRSQVSNWFINARVRLWKPMVEEMYLEEIKEQEQNQSDDKTVKTDQPNEDSASKNPTVQQEKAAVSDNRTNSFMSSPDNNPNHPSHPLISMSTASTSPSPGGYSQSYSGFTLTGSPAITQGSPKKPRSTESLFSPNNGVPSMGMEIKPEEANNDLISSMKFGDDHRQTRDGYSLMSAPTNYISGFGSYPIGEIGRFDATDQFSSPRILNNGVSLTLGLPHCEKLGAHHNFMPNHNIQLGRRVEMGDPNEYSGMSAAATPSTNAYEDLSIQNRKRFAAQLLPDFVA